MKNGTRHLILASASAGRRKLLEAAGLTFECQPADIDEAAIKTALTADGQTPDPGDLAQILAETKASDVAEGNRSALVIGADQILALGSRMFDKPQTLDEARDHLIALRGQTHSLYSGVAIVSNGETIWRHVAVSHLTMRDFSNEFLGGYLAAIGEMALSSVGAYQVEGPGIQLFSKIEGEHSAIIGLPLLALLEFLRAQGVVEA